MSRRQMKIILVFDDPSRGKDALILDSEQAALDHLRPIVIDALKDTTLEIDEPELEELLEDAKEGDLGDLVELFNDYNQYNEHLEIVEGESG